MVKLILEACVETLEQAILAEQCGAHRLELCADLSTGGLTPSPELLRSVMQAVKIPVMAMVRPRAGDFVYSPGELEEMCRSIQFDKENGVPGVVFGCLLPNGEMDVEATRLLCEAAKPMKITFHKAIDGTPDPVRTLKALREIEGISRVLTSGGAETALQGKKILRKMLEAAGEKLTVLVAGKVTKENLGEVHGAIGAREYHGRRIVF